MSLVMRTLSTVMLLVLCASGIGSAQPKALSGPPFKVGVITSLTGVGASFGEDTVIGMKIAVSWVNAHGGVLGRPLVTVIKDDGADAATSAKAALQLIQEEKVVAIIGPPFSSASAAVLPITNDAKIIHLTESILNEEADASKYPYVFKLNTSAETMGNSFIGYLKRAKFKKVAILAADNLQGLGLADVVAAGLKKFGIPMVDREVMTQGTADVTPMLDRIHRQSPDALVLAMAFGPDFVAALKGLKQIGWTDVTPLGTAAINFETVIKGAPPDMLAKAYGGGGYRNLTTECEPPNAKAFRKALSEEAFSRGPITRGMGYIGTNYDGVMLIANAVNATKSTNSDVLKRYLESHSYPGVVARYTYSTRSHGGPREDDFVFVKAGMPKDGLADIAPGYSCK
jgi:branched-chain amino acid transport system substrate-binding protein